ncbi:MAG: nitrilase-related carbon-nitrogen hydrolase [Bacteroidota bacterium]
MRIAVVQTNPIFGEVESNVRAALALMESVEADLYVLPELFNTGYNFIDAEEVRKLSEEVSGSTFQAMEKFAAGRSAYVVYGFAERADRIYNSATLVGPGGFVGVYRKVHLFDRENLFFAPGSLGFPVFDLPIGKVGMMICFDWIYPESARTLALKGTQLIAHPSNLVLPHCPDAMVTRCLENRVFAATANRIGREERGGVDLRYIGKSEIVSPSGRILKRLGEDEPGIAVEEVELAEASDKRINEFNDLLADRRVDQY